MQALVHARAERPVTQADALNALIVALEAIW